MKLAALALFLIFQLTASASDLETEVSGRTFFTQLDTSSYPSELLDAYEQLTPLEQEKFNKKRMRVLKKLGYLLARKQRTGHWIKQTYARAYNKVTKPFFNQAKLIEAGNYLEGSKQWQLNSSEEVRLFQVVDQDLFRNANVIAKSNQFIVMGAVGTNAALGVGTKKKLGFDLQAGLAIAFNKTTHELAIEIFFDRGKIHRIFLPANEIAVNLRFYGGGGFDDPNRTKEQKKRGVYRKIRTIMPVGLTSETAEGKHALFGFTLGPIFPPAPFSTIGTYNLEDRSVILRRFMLPLAWPVQKGKGLVNGILRLAQRLRCLKAVRQEGGS